MTTADDALFEPFNPPKNPTKAWTAKNATLFNSGITKRADAVAVEIITANPKNLYTDIARDMMDYACVCFPQMFDVRTLNPQIRASIPNRALALPEIVERFHNGDRLFWVAAPVITPPRQFEFAGRFGHFKVWKLAQNIPASANIAPGTSITAGVTPAFMADWFWLDTTEAQMSTIELGLMCIHPKLPSSHVFDNQADASRFYAP